MLNLRQLSPNEIPKPTVLSSVIGIATMAARRSEHHSAEEVERYINERSEKLIADIKRGMALS